MSVPVIETRRLILRAPAAHDFGAYVAFWDSPRSDHFGGPFNREEIWDSFLALAGHWMIRGFGQWIIEDKTSGTPAGFIGFYRPDHYEETELGWTVFDGFEGQGLALEGTLAARVYGAEHFGLTSPVSYIAQDNHRSVRLAERLGAICELAAEGDKGPFFAFRHPAPEAVQ